MKSLDSRPSRREVAAGLLVALALAALVCGWQAFWFLTDDAYIAFRYVSNSQLGHGYVWNAPPFLPVEGYTSFLWVVLLDGVWSITGIEPPESANSLLLGFSALTLLLAAGMVWRLPLGERLEPARLLLLALVLAGVVTNRTFLAFASSGLETALFNFLLTAWVFMALFVGRERRWRGPALHGAAALAALARPDGLLFAAASVGIWLCEALAAGVEQPLRRLLATLARRASELAPLLVAAAHLLWRYHTYGAWLPNTYYAKHVRPWPEAGLRYLLSFVLEYALWLWLVLASLWLYGVLRSRVGGRRATPEQVSAPRVEALAPGASRPATAAGFPSSSPRNRKLWPGFLRGLLMARKAQGRTTQAIVVTALLAHSGYYVLVIGGDHFEYRVLSQLVPLVFVSAVWLVNALAWPRALAVGFLALSLVASWPIPWTHYHRSQQRATRQETLFMKVAVADAFPPPLRPYAGLFDRTQAWLIGHMVCTRHREHQVFHRFWRAFLMSRERGLTAPADGYPIHAAASVGIPGWVLPRANVIDVFGLNDRVIARNPVAPNRRRLMGHDRRPPEGYVECFRPNVYLRYQRARTARRHPPLTAEDIRACESRDWLP